MFKPANGLVISYNYLWAREYDGREDGRNRSPRLRPKPHYAAVDNYCNQDKHSNNSIVTICFCWQDT